MVRPRTKSRDDLTRNAMGLFWTQGFAATSMDELVKATGVSRGGIYSDFGGKDDLFLACLTTYRQLYIEPALTVLGSGDDGFQAIEGYFDFFIGLHRRYGMPGPGCFFANVMTERAPHEARVFEVVNRHLEDLRVAFQSALTKCVVESESALTRRALSELADFLATASQGLWSFARSSSDLDELTRFKSVLLELLKARLKPVDRPRSQG